MLESHRSSCYKAERAKTLGPGESLCRQSKSYDLNIQGIKPWRVNSGV